MDPCLVVPLDKHMEHITACSWRSKIEDQYEQTVHEIASVYCKAFGKNEDQYDRILGMIHDEIARCDHHYVLARGPAGLIGFVSWRLDGTAENGLVELYHIGALRHTGFHHIGDQLVEGLINDADAYCTTHGNSHLRMVWLRTHAGGPAEQFYRRFGFTRCECILPDHWRDGVPEVIYQLHVPRWREARIQSPTTEP